LKTTPSFYDIDTSLNVGNGTAGPFELHPLPTGSFLYEYVCSTEASLDAFAGRGGEKGEGRT
jgi:hypothetical protein